MNTLQTLISEDRIYSEVEQGNEKLRKYLLSLFEEVKSQYKTDNLKSDESKLEALGHDILDAIRFLEIYKSSSTEEDWKQLRKHIDRINLDIDIINENQRIFAQAMRSLRGSINNPKNDIPANTGIKRVVLLDDYRKGDSKGAAIEDVKEKVRGTVLETDKFYGNSKVFTLQNKSVRIKRIEGLQFSEDGFASLANQETVSKRIHGALIQSGGRVSRTFKDDLSEIEAGIIPTGDIDNKTIQEAMRISQKTHDGNFAFQISKDLQRKAANDEIFDKNIEGSPILGDHIGNLSSSNPIKIQTVEFPRFDILSLTPVKFQGASGVYHKARVQLIDKQVDYIIRTDVFEVGDLSRKILGTIDNSGRFIRMKESCTVRKIRSQKKKEEKPEGSRLSKFFGKMKDWFTKKI